MGFFKSEVSRRRSSLLSEMSDTLSEDTSRYLKPIAQRGRGMSMDDSRLKLSSTRTELKQFRSKSLIPMQTTAPLIRCDTEDNYRNVKDPEQTRQQQRYLTKR